MLDVMFFEVFKEEEKEIKKRLPKRLLCRFTPKTVAEAGTSACPARLISVRTQSDIPLTWAKHLKGILTRSQGYDHLMEYQKKTSGKVPCGYLGNYCARAVAEQAVLMMMFLMRKLRKQSNQFRSFDREDLTGKECRERNAVVVGVGNIGSEIIDILQGLKMRVRGVDIDPKVKGVEYVPLGKGLSWAEAVFCAVPLNRQTEGMLDYSSLKNAKKGFLLINIARGEITPPEDMEKLLDQRIMGGLAMDVYPEEGSLADSMRSGKKNSRPGTQRILRLAQKENVLFTPHNAFNTQEALKRKAALTVDAVVAFLESGEFPRKVPSR